MEDYDYIKCLWIGNSDKSFLLLVNKNGQFPGNKTLKKDRDVIPLYTKDGENYFQTITVKEAEKKAKEEIDSFVLDESNYAEGFVKYLFSINVSDVFIRTFFGVMPNVYNPPDDSMIFYDRIPKDYIESQPSLDTRKFGDKLNQQNNDYKRVSGDGIWSPLVDSNGDEVEPDDYLVVSKQTNDADKLFIGKRKNYKISGGIIDWCGSPEEYVNQAEKMKKAGFTKPPGFNNNEYNIYVERPKCESNRCWPKMRFWGWGGKQRKKTFNKKRKQKKTRKTKRRRH